MRTTLTNDTASSVRRLMPGEVAQFRELNRLFSQAFDDAENYEKAQPTAKYLESLLAKPHVIPLVAVSEGRVVGGLVAYVLDKFEQERSEVYIYDLAVAEEYRRRGIARSLIFELKKIAQKMGAWVIYVQADKDDADLPARKLYESLGEREDVFHYDIAVN
jgi:aminoglycoside 3-N-acetyltransferase I